MADYIYPHAANPWLTYFASMPTTFDEEDVTTTGTTAGGITDAYIGGGGDGDAGGPIPILPRPREIEDYDWLNKIPAGDPGAGGVGGQLRKWGPTTSAFDIPNFSEIANTMLGREGATEAFAGGAGNVGSRAGLYPDEVANLNTVMQGGYLNANNTGQDIFGVNIVSAGGDYAKRQQEIKDYYDSKSEEELEILMRSKYQRGRRNNANNVVNANSAIVAAEKAATGFITKKDERDEKEEDKRKTRQMPTVPAGGIVGGVWWPGQPTTDPLDNIPIEYASYDLTEDEQAKKDFWADQRWTSAMAENKAIAEEKQRKEEAARPPIQYDETSWSVDSGSSEPPSDDGGYQGTGSEAAQDNYGGGWDDGYWAKGGLIRKKYGNGGIVDLL